MSTPVLVSEELLPIQQIKFGAALAPQTLTAQVYRATIGSEDYAVKLFFPYSLKSRDLDRFRLRAYNLSDDELEARFHPWRREIRVYQQIDKYILGPDRQFFPKYYGATKISRKLCARDWRYTEGRGDIPIVILELLDGKEIHNSQSHLQISDSTRQVAQELYNDDGIDAEYIHIYIHCMEKIEVLHGGRAIHGDIKPDIFMNCASVVIDFSRSWSWEDGKDEPCLDSFSPRHGPRTFETRCEGERIGFRSLVTNENNGLDSMLRNREEVLRKYGQRFREVELRDRVPLLRDCFRCQQAVEEIISTPALSSTDQAEKVEQAEQEGVVVMAQTDSTG